MIASDQPTIFKNLLVTGLSSVIDGNMKKGDLPLELQAGVDENRKKFLSGKDIDLKDTVLVNISYDRNDFIRFHQVDSQDAGKGIVNNNIQVADALCTQTKGLALFLPIADCAGAIIFDPIKEVLMVSHLGRHSSEQYSALKSIEYLRDTFGCNPKDILVWLCPAASSDSYPLYAFMNQSLHEVNKKQFIDAGLLDANIEICNIDTAASKDYFSHSDFLKGNREIDGRFAIVAMLPSK